MKDSRSVVAWAWEGRHLRSLLITPADLICSNTPYTITLGWCPGGPQAWAGGEDGSFTGLCGCFFGLCTCCSLCWEPLPHPWSWGFLFPAGVPAPPLPTLRAFLDHYLKALGFPWWLSDKEATWQWRGHGFEPWSRKISHAMEQISPNTTAESVL